MTSGNDIKADKSTYGGFLTMLKWGAVSAALIAALVIVLIA